MLDFQSRTRFSKSHFSIHRSVRPSEFMSVRHKVVFFRFSAPAHPSARNAAVYTVLLLVSQYMRFKMIQVYFDIDNMNSYSMNNNCTHGGSWRCLKQKQLGKCKDFEGSRKCRRCHLTNQTKFPISGHKLPQLDDLRITERKSKWQTYCFWSWIVSGFPRQFHAF